jgi:hypothetical protein
MSNSYFPEGGMDVVVLLWEVGRGISDSALRTMQPSLLFIYG